MFTRIFYRALAHRIAFANGYTFFEKDISGSSKALTSGLYTLFDSFSNDVCNVRSGYTTLNGNGIYFGDGDDPLSIEDYKLSGECFSTFTASYSKVMNDNGTTTITYTLTNTGEESFTVKEVGVVSYFSSSPYGYFLTYRDLLEEPITIEPGGVGQVTLTFDVNVPS